MLDWPAFLQLPGSATRNFEVLCRNLIRLNYGEHGDFAAVANQPGVEFHLRLHSPCPGLAAAGSWYGWQCRWFELPPAKALGTTRRKKIEKALRTTEKALPDLTDWVLWTRYPLTAGDQKWFRTLKTKFRLHLNTAEDVEALLQGPAEGLRAAYFGELRITPAVLKSQREVALARISKKWLPDVHQSVSAEREIRRMLGEADAWRQALEIAQQIEDTHSEINAESKSGTGRLEALKPPFMDFIRSMARLLREVHAALASGDLELLAQKLGTRPAKVPYSLEAYPRGLRGARLSCGMAATNLLNDMALALRVMADMNTCFERTLVAVVADAGSGKTHLSAELTRANAARPAGVLFHGVNLHHGKTLDDMARSFSVGSRPAPSMLALLVALDAAAQRSRCRLPLVVDGLNEAEDPRDWRPLLEELQVHLEGFPGVMVVVTLRTGARRVDVRWPRQPVDQPARQTFVNDALPADTFQLEIPDFGVDTPQAIEKYLAYYKIRRGEEELPELLSHPLTLRIFCDVTNGDRKKEVGAEAMPGSLAALFEQFVAKAAQSIARRVPLAHRYLEPDIRDALDRMGLMMWQQNRRSVDETAWRQATGDSGRPWNASLVPLLEQEGILLKMRGTGVGSFYLVPTYDAIGGFLIADALLKEHATDLGKWLNAPGVLDSINLTKPNQHPFAEDIFTSLVSLVPRRIHRQQFWSFLSGPLRQRALIEAANLESTYLDSATMAGLSEMVLSGEGWPGTLHQRLFRARASINHPLNAEFLNRALASMTVADRDLRWTEWVRDKSVELHNDALKLTERWQASPLRSETDGLWARWLVWLLPSSVHHLRDRATLALYWFGRGDPEALFGLAEEHATLNDPYVFERLLAANYGVAMALHVHPAQKIYREETLPAQARRLFALLFAKDAPARTTHELIREYARGFLALAVHHHSGLFTVDEMERTKPPFENGGRIDWSPVTTMPKDEPGDSPFRMDFENYTLGRLARDRHNYDYSHSGYQVVRARVRWRVGNLGWSAIRFGTTDKEIASERHSYSRMHDDHFKVDRYGKKYSQIAYSELKGWMIDEGLLESQEDHGRTWNVDIDPSFPNPALQQRIVAVDFLGSEGGSLKEWITDGPVPDLKPYSRLEKIGDLPGPWIALDGYVNQENEKRGRRMFAFLRTFLVSEDRAGTFTRLLAKQPLKGRWLPEKPRIIYTFAGEAPWSETFPAMPFTSMEFVVKESTAKVRRKHTFYSLDGKVVHEMPAKQAKMMHYIPPWMRREKDNYTAEEWDRMVRRDRIVTVEEKVQEKKSFRVSLPVIDFDWEGKSVNNESVHGTSLSRSVARELGLVHLPQTHDMQTKHGERATVGTRVEFAEHLAQKWFYMREDLLRKYLTRRKLRLVSAVWGERELSYQEIERARPGGDLAGFSHGDFQEVFSFSAKPRRNKG